MDKSEMKKLCKAGDKILKKPKKYSRLIENPDYFCEKCGRASNDKSLLCKDTQIIKQ